MGMERERAINNKGEEQGRKMEGTKQNRNSENETTQTGGREMEETDFTIANWIVGDRQN